MLGVLRSGLAVVVGLLVGGPAMAACLPVAEAPGRVVPVGWQTAGLAPGEVELTFLGHASFLIRTPGGVTAVTDYNDVHLPPSPPVIATMNRAHRTHYSPSPDARIRHVLPGWDPDGGVPVHDLQVDDLRVWNVPTNIRRGGGTWVAGNSIFVFEAAGLCIAHLGHLHHPLEAMHLAELGVIDVVLAPIDGIYTSSQENMVRVIDQIGPSVVVPMHYFGDRRLSSFIELMGGRWTVSISDTPDVVLSRIELPFREILVLPGS
jgi:L-ascorbate metabolism protein UlaG (beta-lactamase superfamily)